MTKPDAISATEDFYISECFLIIAKFCENAEYVNFINLGILGSNPWPLNNYFLAQCIG